MHIAWVNEKADFVGGAERYIADLAPRLAEEGHRSTLLYGVHGWMEPSFTERFDAAFPMVDLPAQLSALRPDLIYVHQLAEERALRPIAEAAIPSFRFLHDHKLFCLREHKYTTLAKRTCERRIGVGCYPCLGFINRHDGFALRTVSGLEAQIEINRRLSGVIVGSRYMKEHAQLHGFAPHSVHVARLYVQEPQTHSTVERRDGQLLFVGALLRGKGLDILLHAMTELPSRLQLRVLGTGSQEALFREMADRLGVGSRVFFEGQADRETVEQAYAEASCVVIPSRSPETFSFVGPEALLRGAPVIASGVGGMGEWLVDGETGLAFETCKPSSLAAALRRAMADPEGMREMARRGQARVRETLHPEQHIETLLGVFERAIGEERG